MPDLSGIQINKDGKEGKSPDFERDFLASSGEIREVLPSQVDNFFFEPHVMGQDPEGNTWGTFALGDISESLPAGVSEEGKTDVRFPMDIEDFKALIKPELVERIPPGLKEIKCFRIITQEISEPAQPEVPVPPVFHPIETSAEVVEPVPPVAEVDTIPGANEPGVPVERIVDIIKSKRGEHPFDLGEAARRAHAQNSEQEVTL